jgi:5-methylcytosine-specific restriction endonuclease McrA
VVKTTGKKLREAVRTRHIPQSIRNEVFARDSGRCTFIGTDGRRCNSSWNLEIDHIRPHAKGGSNTTDNLRLLCARHNKLAAEQEYGEEFMKRYHGWNDRGGSVLRALHMETTHRGVSQVFL